MNLHEFREMTQYLGSITREELGEEKCREVSDWVATTREPVLTSWTKGQQVLLGLALVHVFTKEVSEIAELNRLFEVESKG